MKILVSQLIFWDGTKYLVRTDKSNADGLISKTINRKIALFGKLSEEEQLRTKKIKGDFGGVLYKKTQVEMEEEEYNRVRLI